MSSPFQMALPAQADTIQTRFLAFHVAHPEVYRELVRLARRWQRQGNTHGGIKMFWEVLRWERGIYLQRDYTEAYKLNNNYPSRYARLIAERHPDLRDLFTMRGLRA